MNNIFLVSFVILIVFHQANGYTSDDNVEGSTNFSFDLYRQLYSHSDNLVMSPYSLRIILGILYQSSFELAASELQEKLYFGEKSETLNTMTSVISNFTLSPNVKLANKLYLREGEKLRDDFKTVVEQYKSEIELINFSDSEKAADNMNQWVEERTKGLIKNLVEADMINPLTALFIINTLYFKSQWEYEFNNDFVENGTFHGYNENHTIEFMNIEESYRFIKNDEFKVEVIELPYTYESNFVFWVILPFENSNLNELKSHLNHNLITKVNENMRSKSLHLYMPIFKVESEIDGKSVLENMGVETIFTNGQIKILDGNTPLVVSDIRQKSKISVNTEGCEAASASFASVQSRSSFVQSFLPIHVDRPFLYMIMTRDKKEPIFVGHFVKP